MHPPTVQKLVNMGILKGNNESPPTSSKSPDRSGGCGLVSQGLEGCNPSSTLVEKQRLKGCCYGYLLPDCTYKVTPNGRAKVALPKPKTVPKLKCNQLNAKFLLHLEYSVILSKLDDTIKRPPSDCVAIYLDAFKYGLRFPMHRVIERYVLTMKCLQLKSFLPLSKIYSFIATYKLRHIHIPYLAHTFAQVHTIKASGEARQVGWYCFNNNKGYMSTTDRRPNLGTETTTLYTYIVAGLGQVSYLE